MKRKKWLVIGMGFIMGLTPVSAYAVQPENIPDEIPEANVIMQTEEMLVDGESAEEELQDQVDILEQEEELHEILYEDGIEEMEEPEIELSEVNQETIKGDVAIDETNFPDDNFRQYVLEHIDKNKDGKLSVEEISSVESIWVYGKINSLKGIEYFTALENLDCECAQLSSLDMSNNPALKKLECSGNQLESLDVSKNLALEVLYCLGNQLKSLDVSNNPALKTLGCDNNQLESLDVSNNLALETLHCDNNQLKSLDVSNNPSLRELSCCYNQLSSLDIENSPTLTWMGCWSNRLIIGRKEINILLYDNKFNVGRVSNLQNLSLDEGVFTILEENKFGTYDYDCGNNYTMTVTISEDGKEPVQEETGLESYIFEYRDINGNQITTAKPGDTVYVIYEFVLKDGWNRDEGGIPCVYLDENFTYNNCIANMPEWKFSSLEYPGDGHNRGKCCFTIPSDTKEKKIYSYVDIWLNPPKSSWTRHKKYYTVLDIEHEPNFEDVEVNPGNWKYEAVKYVYNNNIMGGVGGSNQFQPDNSLTRAMFATVLYRMAGEPSVEYSSKFSDVEAGKWYSEAIIWANQKGIVSGYSDGKYGINDNITREQIAKMLYLYGKSQGYDVSGVSSLNSFTDKDAVSGWAVDYMQWAVNAQMISGKPNGDGTFRLDPKGQATRAECAKMLMMFMEKYGV